MMPFNIYGYRCVPQPFDESKLSLWSWIVHEPPHPLRTPERGKLEKVVQRGSSEEKESRGSHTAAKMLSPAEGILAREGGVCDFMPCCDRCPV